MNKLLLSLAMRYVRLAALLFAPNRNEYLHVVFKDMAEIVELEREALIALNRALEASEIEPGKMCH